MNTVCPGILDGAFLESVLRFVDCQAQTLGSQGYQALAAPGSTLSLMLAGMVTLFVVFFGYRMLFGETPTAREGIISVAKIGIVLALATSWTAYRTLAYDVAFHTPAELMAEVGGAAGVPGSGGGLVSRLEAVDDAFIALGRLGTGPINMTTQVTQVNGQSMLTAAQGAPEPPSIFGSFALGTARLVFLTATIAGLASVRLLAGLLLAIGPLFIAFLLFQGTRSLFEGWVRALVAAVIGALAVTMLLGIELSLLEPWLATLILRRQAELPIGGAATELLVVSLAFAIATIAGLGMAARVTIGFRLPSAWREASRQSLSLTGEPLVRHQTAGHAPRAPSEQLSRAAAVSEAVSHLQRREAASQVNVGAPSRASSTMPQRDRPVSASAPLGQTHRRRVQNRVSTSAGRRDRIS